MKSPVILSAGLLLLGTGSRAQSGPASPFLQPAHAQMALPADAAPAQRQTTTSVSVPSRSVTHQWAAGRWANGTLYTYLYSGQARPREVLLADSATGTPQGRRLLSYDAQGQPLEQINQAAAGSAYQNQLRYAWTYDSHGFNTEILVQSWQNNAWATQSGSRRLTTYNAGGTLTELLFQQWQNGAWVSSGRNLYTVDAANRWVEIRKYDWYNGAWSLSGRTHNIVWFDWSTWRASYLEGQEWLAATGTWDDADRTTSTYGPNGSHADLTEVSPAPGVWQNDQRFTETFDAHLYSQGYRYEAWTNNSWQITQAAQNQAQYPPDGALRRYLTQRYDSILPGYVNSTLENFTSFVSITLGTTTALAAGSSLYPNPTAGSVTLQVTGLREQPAVEAEVVNALGVVVQKLSFQPRQGRIQPPLDVSALPAGVYFLRLHCAEGSFVKRLVKQ